MIQEVNYYMKKINNQLNEVNEEMLGMYTFIMYLNYAAQTYKDNLKVSSCSHSGSLSLLGPCSSPGLQQAVLRPSKPKQSPGNVLYTAWTIARGLQLDK